MVSGRFALVPVRDFAYVTEDRTFLFVANRFRWEGGVRSAPGEAGFERILCGITFSEVTAGKCRMGGGFGFHGLKRGEETPL